MASVFFGFLFPPTLPFLEHEKHCRYHQCESNRVVPLELLFQIQQREHYEHSQCYHFLQGFQVRGVPIVVSDSVCGHLQAVFENAIPQLATTASHSGALLNFRCPYQANIINTFERTSSTIGSRHFMSFAPDCHAAVFYVRVCCVGEHGVAVVVEPQSRGKLSDDDCESIIISPSAPISPAFTRMIW